MPKLNQQAEMLRANILDCVLDMDAPALQGMLEAERTEFESSPKSLAEWHDFCDMTLNILCWKDESGRSIISYAIANRNYECLKIINEYVVNLQVQANAGPDIDWQNKLKGEDFLFSKEDNGEDFYQKVTKEGDPGGVILHAFAAKRGVLPYKYYSQRKAIGKDSIKSFVESELTGLLFLDNEERAFYKIDSKVTEVIEEIFQQGETLAEEWKKIENDITHLYQYFSKKSYLSTAINDFVIKLAGFKRPWYYIIKEEIQNLSLDTKFKEMILKEYDILIGVEKREEIINEEKNKGKAKSIDRNDDNGRNEAERDENLNEIGSDRIGSVEIETEKMDKYDGGKRSGDVDEVDTKANEPSNENKEGIFVRLFNLIAKLFSLLATKIQNIVVTTDRQVNQDSPKEVGRSLDEKINNLSPNLPFNRGDADDNKNKSFKN